MKSPARLLAVCLVLATLTFLAYSNSFHAGFALDNKALILEDARVHAFTRENVDLILQHTYWWPIGESGLYRPVTTLSYLFNYAVLGNRDNPLGYHAVNLALHVANVLLLFALGLRIADLGLRNADSGQKSAIRNPKSKFQSATRSPQSAIHVAGVAAALWAVHPLSTEAVTNIVGRADLLAAFAVLSGLLAYMKSTESSRARRLFWLAVLAATTTLGVFAKESAVVIVGVILLYEIIRIKQPQSSPSPRSKPFSAKSVSSKSVGYSLMPIVGAMLALAVPLSLLFSQRAAVLGTAPAPELPFVDNPIAGAGFWTGRLTAVAVMARYLRLLLWPATLSADYSYAQIPLVTGSAQDWLSWLVVAIAVAGILVLWRRRQLDAFFFAAFAVISFLPASNLLFPTGTIMAERVMYLPSIGVIAAVVIAADALTRAKPAAAGVQLIVVCLLVAVGGVRTWYRNIDWQNDLTLWSSAAVASPRSFKAHRALAEALYEQDPTHANIARVVGEIDKSVAVLASLPDTQNDARTYRQAGAYHLEEGDARRGSAPDPRAPIPPESIDAYQKAVPLLLRCLAIIDAANRPATAAPRADAYRILSAVYTRLNQADRGIDAAARARELDPDSAVGYQQSAAALLAASREDEAAVVLMVGSMVTRDRGLRDELVDLYRRGLDPLGCAVVSTPNGPAINPSCETVRTHVCRATVEAIRIQQRAGRAGEARTLQDSASRQFRCP